MNDSSHAESGAGPLAAISWSRVSVLEWSQPKRLERTWQLRADGEIAARMSWHGPWDRGFTARMGGGEWRIREPFFRAMSIERAGEETPVARVRSGWFGRGTIERVAGESMSWRREGWAGRNLVLASAEGFPAFHVRGRRGFLKTEGAVELEDAGRRLPDIEPLVLITWASTLTRTRGHGG